MRELNAKCLEETKKLTKSMTATHMSKETALRDKIKQLLKQVKAEEEKLLQIMSAMNKSNKNEESLQSKIKEMLAEFKQEEDKLKANLDALKKDQEAEKKDLEARILDLKSKMQAESKKGDQGVAELQAKHSNELSALKTKINSLAQSLEAQRANVKVSNLQISQHQSVLDDLETKLKQSQDRMRKWKSKYLSSNNAKADWETKYTEMKD